MKNWQILRKSWKKYENLANFERETEIIPMKIWPILRGRLKYMKIRPSLSKRLKKYENLANFEIKIEKV